MTSQLGTRLVLASASPRRSNFLREWGIHEFTLSPADIDETVDLSRSLPQMTLDLARKKAAVVAARCDWDLQRHFVLAADTLVGLEGQPLGKPESRDDAVRMLLEQSGRRVEVVTGVVVQSGSSKTSQRGETVVSKVFMKSFSKSEAEAYVATGEPMDKAGAFAIQGGGASLIDRHEGSFSNIVGFPKALVLRLLKESGFVAGEAR